MRRRLSILVVLLVSAAVARADIVPFGPVSWFARGAPNDAGVSASAINAAGKSATLIGHVYLPTTTGSKTCSSSGCTIHFTSDATTTFANGTTNLRVGIQDVTTSTGFEDGTFDVYADLVGGTDTVVADVIRPTAMESGSKTVSHGDLIAVSIEMTARGGADVVTVPWAAIDSNEQTRNFGFPYGTGDNGSGPVKTTSGSGPLFLIEFDDGTVGWIAGAPLLRNLEASPTLTAGFDSADSPDEYAAVFQVAAAISVPTVCWKLESIGTGDTFEMIVYSDALGTPAAISGATWAPDPDGLVSDFYACPTFATPVQMVPGEDYAIAVRATHSTNTIQVSYWDLGTGGEILKDAQPVLDLILAGRTNQTGPFVAVDADDLPDVGFFIGGVSDGTSSGGGETSHVFVQ